MAKHGTTSNTRRGNPAFHKGRQSTDPTVSPRHHTGASVEPSPPLVGIPCAASNSASFSSLRKTLSKRATGRPCKRVPTSHPVPAGWGKKQSLPPRSHATHGGAEGEEGLSFAMNKPLPTLHTIFLPDENGTPRPHVVKIGTEVVAPVRPVPAPRERPAMDRKFAGFVRQAISRKRA